MTNHQAWYPQANAFATSSAVVPSQLQQQQFASGGSEGQVDIFSFLNQGQGQLQFPGVTGAFAGGVHSFPAQVMQPMPLPSLAVAATMEQGESGVTHPGSWRDDDEDSERRVALLFIASSSKFYGFYSVVFCSAYITHRSFTSYIRMRLFIVDHSNASGQNVASG